MLPIRQRTLLGYILLAILILPGCFGTANRFAGISGRVLIDSGAFVDSPSTPYSPGSLSSSLPGPSAQLTRRFKRPSESGQRTEDEFILYARPGTSGEEIRRIVERHGFSYLRPSGDSFHIVVREGTSLAVARTLLESVPEIIDLEWNAPVVLLDRGGTIMPDDPHFEAGHQWSLEQIRAPRAWNALQQMGQSADGLGDDEIIVAIIDTGIDFTHEDLADSTLWVEGWDFTVSNGGEPYGYDIEDLAIVGKAADHGTLVAGIIGALTNNGKGIAGITGMADEVVRLMPIRVFYEKDGEMLGVRIATIAESIEWAVDQEARVINLSLGIECALAACPPPDTRLSRALDYAWEKGATVVAASGNYSGGVVAPANYHTVIAVGATGHDRQISTYTSRGMEMNLVAPGGTTSQCKEWSQGIIGPKSGDPREYHCLAGTSFAAPHVTGVVALMMARNRNSDPEEIMRTLEITAQRSSFASPFEFDPDSGWGIVDAYGAITGGVPLVFVASERDNHLSAPLAPVKAVGAGGLYYLGGVPKGKWAVYAWVDVDGSGTVNDGDYFGSLDSISVAKGDRISNLDIVLTPYEGDTLTVGF